MEWRRQESYYAKNLCNEVKPARIGFSHPTTLIRISGGEWIDEVKQNVIYYLKCPWQSFSIFLVTFSFVFFFFMVDPFAFSTSQSLTYLYCHHHHTPGFQEHCT